MKPTIADLRRDYTRDGLTDAELAHGIPFSRLEREGMNSTR